MPKIKYVEQVFTPKSMMVIEQALTIIAEYAAQGFDLTLRQLYYQFVSRDLLPNKLQSYKRLGSIVNDARLAGLIDWHTIVDRTRNLRSLSHWENPADIVTGAAAQFRVDKWATQPNRVEVWIEKDALIGVIEGVCEELDVPYFSCRGYTSQSELWSAGRRLRDHSRRGQEPIVLHFGDHDPSGIDMTRDISDRLALFTGDRIDVRRLALNMEQVEEHNPPPNPAKETDSRHRGYQAEHGDESWELDALEPALLADLIRTEILSLREEGPWDEAVAQEEEGKAALSAIAERFEDVQAFLAE